MKNTFEWTALSGAKAEIVAEYNEVMEMEVSDSDGYIIEHGMKPTLRGCNMIAYVDGKKLDSCYNPEFWKLIDINKPGIKKIWGMPIGLNAENASRYEKFIAELVEAGTADEVKAYRAEQAEAKRAIEIKNAKAIIAEAEKQRDIPSAAEARRRERIWNNINNEGGEGYIARWISREEYEAAKKIVNGK